MKTFKIKLHSSVDLITNSSTVIFTYSEGSLQAVKDLVNEMLKVFNQNLTFDDLFYAGIFVGDDYYFESEDFPQFEDIKDYKEIEKLQREYLSNLKLQILKDEIEKPNWVIEVEKLERCDYPIGTYLELAVKDEKYSELANKLLKYLYSTDHEATRDG